MFENPLLFGSVYLKSVNIFCFSFLRNFKSYSNILSINTHLIIGEQNIFTISDIIFKFPQT